MHYKKILGRVAFLLCFVFLQISFAQTPKDTSFFKDKPNGVAKDFYIYRYLNSSWCTKEDAWKLLAHTNRMSTKLFHAFAKKLDAKGILHDSKCMKMKTIPLLETKDKECIALGLSVYEGTKLEKRLLRLISKMLEPYKEAIAFKILAQKDVYAAMLSGNNDEFFEVFNKVGSAYRRAHFDKQISTQKIAKLSADWRINTTIKYIVTDVKIKEFQKSLLHIKPDTKVLNHLSLFYLGLNALKLENKKKAMEYFEIAYEKAYYKMDKDKVLFWQYQTTKDERYKKQILESFDLNIYTILMGKRNHNVMLAKAYEPHPFYDEKNPFGWTTFLKELQGKNKEELEALAKVYLYGSTLPHFSYIMEKASGYKDHYFPVPYPKYLKADSVHRKALILSIARQESRFIPSAISHSYALGMMQFMPFLARAIAKEQKYKNFDLDDMFDPETAYMFADIHLDYLEKYLHHPLFVAYAYNGGIGFTKKLYSVVSSLKERMSHI